MDSKFAAASAAVKMVKDGMVVGLGTGSTASIFIQLLAKQNLNVRCIPTSCASEKQARSLGLRVIGFEQADRIDLAVDGADQVDPKGNLIKGMGGALVREKAVDYRAKKFVVIVGSEKLQKRLSGIVPVEVVPFAQEAVKKDLLGLGAKEVQVRADGEQKFVSDNGNLILHAKFGQICNPAKLEDKIKLIAGVVDCGIFAKKKPVVVVGHKSGAWEVIKC
ncbi:MAG: ribose-5-phosphate isomerase RpiA [Candidatus Anstonellaceae archaeon]